METTTQPPNGGRRDAYTARMEMTPRGWIPGGSCRCGAASRDHVRQTAAGRWRCTKCGTKYRQRGDRDGLFLVSTT